MFACGIVRENVLGGRQRILSKAGENKHMFTICTDTIMDASINTYYTDIDRHGERERETAVLAATEKLFFSVPMLVEYSLPLELAISPVAQRFHQLTSARCSKSKAV